MNRPETASRPGRLRRWLQIGRVRRFGRAEDGAAAVEFAIVGVPFFLMLTAILELGLAFFASMALDAGTDQFARLIKTNQVTNGSLTNQQFRTQVCNMPIMSLFDCENMTVDVQVVASWTTPGVPRDADGNLDDSGMGFAPGGRSTINVMRVFYEFPVFFAWVPTDNPNMWSNGNRLLMASSAFVIEP